MGAPGETGESLHPAMPDLRVLFGKFWSQFALLSDRKPSGSLQGGCGGPLWPEKGDVMGHLGEPSGSVEGAAIGKKKVRHVAAKRSRGCSLQRMRVVVGAE